MLLALEVSVESEETVTLPKAEYDALIADSNLLSALQSAGVDGWDGYEEAQLYMENV